MYIYCKIRDFFPRGMFVALTTEMGVGPWGVPAGPILWVMAGGAEPGCPVVAVPSGCPGVVALPPSMMVFCWELTTVLRSQ